jgi:hypothetical protein
MERRWLAIRIELLGSGGLDLELPPGRVLIVGPSHSFGHLAEAINLAFARWDLSHLHEFELADGRRVGYPNEDFAPEVIWEDQAKLKVCRELGPGDEFSFSFDLGDNWRHRCTVEPEKVDPVETYGEVPAAPVAIWGWGSIPDQYGRASLEE